MESLFYRLNVLTGSFLRSLHLFGVTSGEEMAKLARPNLRNVRVNLAKGDSVRQMMMHHLACGLIHFGELHQAEDAYRQFAG
ncbi:MAG: hypothetical protein KatS3mg023_3493 [Armatimonadota bacterium]|nr:MAG: hypothetical protein KatS3mg023_3493 [Armatimonadota bacterium]